MSISVVCVDVCVCGGGGGGEGGEIYELMNKKHKQVRKCGI